MIQIRILELNTFDGKIHRPKAYIENLKIQWRNIGVKCKLKKIYQKLINDIDGDSMEVDNIKTLEDAWMMIDKLQCVIDDLRNENYMLNKQVAELTQRLQDATKHNARGAGRPKYGYRWVERFAEFSEMKEARKSRGEIMAVMCISAATYQRYNKLFNDTRINV